MFNQVAREDQVAILIFWLALMNLGFEIQDQDLSEPGYMRYDGAHTIYTFAVLLCDDEDFPVEQFRDMLTQYAAISPEIKPQLGHPLSRGPQAPDCQGCALRMWDK